MIYILHLKIYKTNTPFRIEDLATVLNQSTEHRHRLLLAASRTLRSSYVKVIFGNSVFVITYKIIMYKSTATATTKR